MQIKQALNVIRQLTSIRSRMDLPRPTTIVNLSESPIPTVPTIFPGFNLPLYDRIELSYTGENITSVVYKNDGVTVATLTLGYTNNVLTSVERV